MKIAGYISISILLALGCAGRIDKVRGENEKRLERSQVQNLKPDYQYLIDMYNEGRYDEFYGELNRLTVLANLQRIKDVNSVPGHFAAPDMVFEIQEDSAQVTILILRPDMQLIKILMNQIIFKGAYACYFNDLLYFNEGSYYLIKKVGSEKLFKRIVLLK
jgi:hypothetical protein